MLYVNPLATSYRPATPVADALGAANGQEGDPREPLALKEMERYFVYTLLQEMRKSVPKDGMFDLGLQSQLQDEMLDDALAGQIAESGQLGIARAIEQQLRISDIQRSLGSGPTR
ncbi:MAG: hypothetical protein GY851_28465 [bacterium]|nr:hypothetical protein [bacterium]